MHSKKAIMVGNTYKCMFFLLHVRDAIKNEMKKKNLKQAGISDIINLAKEFAQEMLNTESFLINIKRPDGGYKIHSHDIDRFMEKHGLWIQGIWKNQFVIFVEEELKKHGYFLAERLYKGITQ